MRKGTRRKLNSFCYNMMIQSVTNRAERDGLAIAFVDPAYTSQICSQCGLIGDRAGLVFIVLIVPIMIVLTAMLLLMFCLALLLYGVVRLRQ